MSFEADQVKRIDLQPGKPSCARGWHADGHPSIPSRRRRRRRIKNHELSFSTAGRLERLLLGGPFDLACQGRSTDRWARVGSDRMSHVRVQQGRFLSRPALELWPIESPNKTGPAVGNPLSREP